MNLVAHTDHWIVVDKPAGWLSIPGRGVEGVPVLSETLVRKFGKVWVCHRLDRETSGLIIFARDADTHRQLSLQFQNREVRKSYVLLAGGVPALPSFVVQSPINGAPSRTRVEVLETGTLGFYARANPTTGRRHQIRIHLAERGHPLWGDTRYGGRGDFPRTLLHAETLEIPGTGKWSVEPPSDFLEALTQLREIEFRV